MEAEEHDSSSNFIEMSRRSLFIIFKESTAKKFDDKLSFMELKLREITNCPQKEFKSLSHDLKHFKLDLKKRWKLSNYMEERFNKKNESWLNSSILVHTWIQGSKPGRPSKDFQELCDRSKRRRTKDLREQVPVEELTYAASSSQRSSGNTAASKMIKDVTLTPTRAKKYRKVLHRAFVQKKKTKKYTPEEGLALFIEGNFTRRQWELIHKAHKGVFPCYTIIREAKKVCYPKQESMRVTDTCAEVFLQDLVDHTATRLCLYLDEVLNKCAEEELKNLELITKWGCDGSHQVQYQQKFSDPSQDDANIFQSSMVRLRLQSKVGNETKVLWQNPTPSSTRFCRPIRLRFLHETVDVTKEEIKYIEDQEKQLLKTKIAHKNGVIYVKHVLLPTMVDAKVCNAATNTTSTMRCYICGKTSKTFNDLNKTGVVDPLSLRFGLSILHARIRLFETILHLAYKLPLQKWQARSNADKKIVKDTKEKIQKEYRDRTGLIIDMPKAGFGNSNAGNTSRRFFSDPDLAAEITGIDKMFITRIKVILEAISSGRKINVIKFEEFCEETSKMYVQLYGWHPMTPTLHKILAHGSTVIDHAILPIGQLSEEAAEARNKHYRSYRHDFARKFSRVQCNLDILYRLLLTSDPFFSCKRKHEKSKSQPFSPETLELLEADEPNVDEESD